MLGKGGISVSQTSIFSISNAQKDTIMEVHVEQLFVNWWHQD